MTNGTGPLQIGLLLRTGEQSRPTGRVVGWSEIREMSVMAEAVGFDTIWMADHLIMRNAGSVVMPPVVLVRPARARACGRACRRWRHDANRR